MDLKFLEAIRLREFEAVLTVLRRHQPEGVRILEIGAGSGWQARELAARGYRVEAIDLPQSRYAPHRVWPITDYDGRRIPFPERVFDVVFSSNVLEHVLGLEPFLAEIARVLKPGGVAIHVLPTAHWRLWTVCTHYATLMQAAGLWALHSAGLTSGEARTSARERLATVVGSASGRARVRRALIPSRHGEVGNSLTELWVFSRWRWRRLFRRAGWEVRHYTTNHLAYSGNGLFGGRISLVWRRRWSRCLGSACHLFVLRRPPG